MPKWTWLVPVIACIMLASVIIFGLSPLVAGLCALSLMSVVFASVHHAEVVAHRLGEPFGTLVFAVAVTVIEASLIISMMLSGGDDNATLPRDTIYAAVMIICSGVVGVCILLGGLSHREQVFRVDGAGAALAALITMACLSLILPTFTSTTAGPTYSGSQLAFVAAASLSLWAVFVFIQTIRHRDYFLPTIDSDNPEVHAEPPTQRQALFSFALLIVSLVAVVGLAKMISPSIEQVVDAAGAPKAVIGIVIAMLVLLPETWAAVRAAQANRLQTSINLALGSAIASIGLTIPAVALASIIFDLPLVLGIEAKEMVLLVLVLLVSSVTLATGRTHIMQGAVHLVIFMAYLFMTFVP